MSSRPTQPSQMRRGARSPPVSQTRYYSKQKGIQRPESVQGSLPPSPSHENHDSFGTAYSDERNISNAIHMSTSNEGYPSYETSSQMCPIMEDGQAANMAMFLPHLSSNDEYPFPQSQYSRKQRQKAQDVGQGKVLSDLGPQSRPEELCSASASGLMPAVETEGYQRVRSASFSQLGMHNNYRRLSKNAVPMAVSPAKPRFPPPERSPTPPGLPSFNTPEAVEVAERFNERNNASRSTRGNARANGSNANFSLGSYGEAIWRFLTRSPAANTRPARQPNINIQGIGCASDGTFIQGRFPVRNSGHGTNHIRQIQNHQFHRSDLPPADVTPENVVNEPEDEESTNKGTSANGERQNRTLHSRHFLSRLWTSPDARTATSTGSAAPGSSSVVRSPVEPPAAEPGLSRAQQDERTDENSQIGASHILNAILWIPLQLFKCLCFAERAEDETIEPLEAIISHDTYQTARSQPSSERASLNIAARIT